VGSGEDVAIVVEEAVEGPEYSAEVVWEATNRRWKLVGLTQTHISPAPHRRELGVVFPGFPENIVPIDVENLLYRWLGAVGLESSVAHVELRMTQDGPALIEINPRFAGGDIPRIVQHCVGTNLVAHYVGLHCNADAVVELSQVRGGGSIWFVSPSVSGSLVSMTPPDHPWPEGVDVFYRPLPPGMAVTPQSRLAYVVATASNPDEAFALATSHAAAHRLEVRERGTRAGV
jgi:hypothetical protein